ncbi:hypothetical protein TNCV_4937551 [Trichonephila clavipes]|nr:hypothetical protein TNCV_4937551 [Trichonephila clavipes]
MLSGCPGVANLGAIPKASLNASVNSAGNFCPSSANIDSTDKYTYDLCERMAPKGQYSRHSILQMGFPVEL